MMYYYIKHICRSIYLEVDVRNEQFILDKQNIYVLSLKLACGNHWQINGYDRDDPDVCNRLLLTYKQI